ncbi:LysR family transcriptional regulator [Flavobacteriaceae bacterium]|jgi:LysR family hydrogen peroxide-inducible transcriptional activator|nr:LysR family transcriptional regulator [Flavobacteriaceae bacterium]
MTITQLNYIITLEKTRNFTKAANLCKVSQPTLSMQIQKLEEELKVNIFDRTKKPIELSDLGIKIINQAKKILIEFKKMDDVLNDKKEVLKGQYIFKNFKS